MVMQNLFGSTTPAGAFTNGSPLALGTALKFAVDGWVYGLRMHISPDFNPSVHSPYLGSLWQMVSPDDQSHTGIRVAAKEYPNASVVPGEWYDLLLDEPLAVIAAATYRSIYWAPSGRYVATGHIFQSSGVTNGDIYSYQDGEGPPAGFGSGVVYNGSFNETSDSVEHYPIDHFNQTCYFSDVIFSTDDPSGGGGDTGAASRFFAFF